MAFDSILKVSDPKSISFALEDVGKKFYQRWLFKGISHDFQEAPHVALVGRNGSGKSTLMRIIAGQMLPSVGSVTCQIDEKPFPKDKFYQIISWSGPYIDLYEDLTLKEQIDLHFALKKCLLSSPRDIIALLRLEAHQHKQLRLYSSGMLQRVKVGLAVLTDTPILLLDEPTSNMDPENAAIMLALIQEHTQNRIMVLASNMEREYLSFDHVLKLS